MASSGRPGRSWSARLRELRIIARAALDERRPLLVQIIPMRRCNLACGYYNEYDHLSPPVPAEVRFERIDLLAAMGTAVVTLITNGLLLGPDRIKALNAVHLDRLQVSIDNLKPDGDGHLTPLVGTSREVHDAFRSLTR